MSLIAVLCASTLLGLGAEAPEMGGYLDSSPRATVSLPQYQLGTVQLVSTLSEDSENCFVGGNLYSSLVIAKRDGVLIGLRFMGTTSARAEISNIASLRLTERVIDLEIPVEPGMRHLRTEVRGERINAWFVTKGGKVRVLACTLFSLNGWDDLPRAVWMGEDRSFSLTLPPKRK